MLEKPVLYMLMAFWSLLALFLVGSDMCSNYHLIIDRDWFIMINRQYNCSLAYALIIPCLFYTLINSLMSIKFEK